MLVVGYSACEITWHIWEQSVVAVRGVAPVAAIEIPPGTYQRYRGTTVVRLTVKAPSVDNLGSVRLVDRVEYCHAWSDQSSPTLVFFHST